MKKNNISRGQGGTFLAEVKNNKTAYFDKLVDRACPDCDGTGRYKKIPSLPCPCRFNAKRTFGL